MSADNGVYILETRDKQIRVVHSQAIEGLFNNNGDYIPRQINKYFGDSKYTKDMSKAVKIARKIRRKLPICEYGISILPYCDKTWKQIMNESVKEKL